MVAIVIFLATFSAVMGMMFACGVLGPEPQIVAAIHTITAECVCADEIARAYGWRRDWRDYMEQTRRLNGWESWPLLHVGEKIIVPDYRDKQNALQAGGAAQSGAAQRKTGPPATPQGRVAGDSAAVRGGNSSPMILGCRNHGGRAGRANSPAQGVKALLDRACHASGRQAGPPAIETGS